MDAYFTALRRRICTPRISTTLPHCYAQQNRSTTHSTAAYRATVAYDGAYTIRRISATVADLKHGSPVHNLHRHPVHNLHLMNLTTLSDLTHAALALAEECGYSIEVEATDGTRQVLQRRHAQRTLVVLLGADRAAERQDVHTRDRA